MSERLIAEFIQIILRMTKTAISIVRTAKLHPRYIAVNEICADTEPVGVNR